MEKLKNMATDPIAPTEFGTMEERQSLLKKKSIKDFINIGTVATAFFIIGDFVPLYIRWGSVQNTYWYLVLLLAAISAVVIDLPMYIAGRKIKEYLSGLITRKELLPSVSLAIAAFLIAYIPFFIFSMATKDLTFQINHGNTQTIVFEDDEADPGTAAETDAETAESDDFAILVASIFSALLPLGSSCAALLCGLVTYKPIEDRLDHLETANLLAHEHRSMLIWALAQISVRKKQILTARENDLFNVHIEGIKAQEQIRFQSSQVALQEALAKNNDMEGVLHVTENALKHMPASTDEEFHPEILDVLKDSLAKESEEESTEEPDAESTEESEEASLPGKADFLNTVA